MFKKTKGFFKSLFKFSDALGEELRLMSSGEDEAGVNEYKFFVKTSTGGFKSVKILEGDADHGFLKIEFYKPIIRFKRIKRFRKITKFAYVKPEDLIDRMKRRSFHFLIVDPIIDAAHMQMLLDDNRNSIERDLEKFERDIIKK